MPAKNAAPYLEECLQSILEQTYKQWELVIADDHSVDETAVIARSFSQRDPRIRLIKNKGVGIISALQSAYELTSGTFIHRMDADDLMPKDKLAELLYLLNLKGPGTLATGMVKYFAVRGVSNGYRKYERWLNQLCINNTHWKELYKECVVASPCWLVHRSDFEKCGGFDSSYYPEDYDLVFRFYKAGLNVVSVPKVLHLWRDHAQRTSRNHVHYQQNAFFQLKLHYFLELDYRVKRPLIIWGAGPKGKIMAKLLKANKIPFQWVSNNPNKHGKEIYDQLMRSFTHIITQERPQVIITVAQRNAQTEIFRFLENLKLSPGEDFFFFR
jgi:glycosyltransferase involved in cell wall biosynthesis